ncbi:hypothetical protein CCP3SC5AM1_720016 [Gammaproteobacteria bacterium]
MENGTEIKIDTSNIMYMLGQLQGKVTDVLNEQRDQQNKTDKIIAFEERMQNILLNISDVKKDIELLMCRLSTIESKVHVIYQIAGYTISILGVGASLVGTFEMFLKDKIF